jgi:pimeloyl-ACP methyl ester carboxylesterase
MATLLAAQKTITFPTEDGGKVCADLYGPGSRDGQARAVVLAHGGRFNKESWRDQAHALLSQGFRVLAIDFRGFGCSTGPGRDLDNVPFNNDVLAAVRYLKAHGPKPFRSLGAASEEALPAMRPSSPRQVKLIESYFSARRPISRPTN